MRISVASGKGGTGKTTIATNLALSIGSDVQLLDCDVEECPERPCNQLQMVRVPDECCPLCLDQDCLFDNRFLINGEWFQPAADKCTNCTCNVSPSWILLNISTY